MAMIMMVSGNPKTYHRQLPPVSTLKVARSTTSIPTFNYSNVTIGNSSSHQIPSRTYYCHKAKSLANGLNTSNSSSSNHIRSARPSSIPRLIPLSNNQRKEAMLRNVLTRNMKDLKENQNGNTSEADCSNGAAGLGGTSFKRPRLSYGIVPTSRLTTNPISLSNSLKKVRSFSSLVVTESMSSKRAAPCPVNNPQSLQAESKKTETVKSALQQLLEDNLSPLRSQIRRFFVSSSGNYNTIAENSGHDIQATIEPYFSDIINTELENEIHTYNISLTKEFESQLSKRLDMVKFIRRASDSLGLLPETLHRAIYLTDAVLRLQIVPVYSVECFAAAVLFIAAKQEENDCPLKPQDILKYCSISNFTPRRLVLTEGRILVKLMFRTCCPSSYFFMEACLSSMTFRNEFLRMYSKGLAERILYDALFEAEFALVANSVKAQFALHYAVKYVSYNYDLLQINYGTDKRIWGKFSKKCFPEFRNAVLHGISLPKHFIKITPPPKKRILKDLTNSKERSSSCRRLSTVTFSSGGTTTQVN